MSCLFFSEIMMDVTRPEGLARCLPGQLLFTCLVSQRNLVCRESGFPFLVSCTCQSFLFAANMSMICCRKFRRKKIARSSGWVARRKWCKGTTTFWTGKIFVKLLTNFCIRTAVPRPRGWAVSRLRVQRYGDFSKRTKFFGVFFRKKLLFLVFSQDT